MGCRSGTAITYHCPSRGCLLTRLLRGKPLPCARHPDASPRIPKGSPRADPRRTASGALLALANPKKSLLAMGSLKEPKFRGGKCLSAGLRPGRDNFLFDDGIDQRCGVSRHALLIARLAESDAVELFIDLEHLQILVELNMQFP